MKIKELIESLKKYDENLTVFVGNYKSCENDRDIKAVDQDANNEVMIVVEDL